MKKIVSVLFIGLSFFAYGLEPIKSGDPLKDSADLANRRTALRCLSNATNYASDKNYEAALSQAQLGIAYDDSISDLWYVMAACGSQLGQTRAEILPVLERSLENNNWVNYNRDNARLMAADIFSETNCPQKALELLDSKPVLYSSDAEFVRVKTYYRLGDPDSISKARNKIDGARRIYPSDTRFPLVFFRNEDPEAMDPSTKRIADYFILQIAQYQEASPDKDAELEIYGASFAEGEVKTRLLKSFAARGLEHPLYAREALKAGLMDQQHAFEYICHFAETSLDMDLFKSLLSQLTDKDVVDYSKKYLESFDGILVSDTDGDGNWNIEINYVRGRPQKISYDRNHDGRLEWEIYCDFGVPVSGILEQKKMSFTWSQFPYLSSIAFNMDTSDTVAGEKFTFAGEALVWSPVMIEQDKFIAEKTGAEFFCPVLKDNMDPVTNAQLLDAASAFEIDSTARNGERICFILLNGNVTQSMYYRDGILYAQAQFEGNIPVLRVVDCDNDGVFETTEFYDIDTAGTMEVHSLKDERTIMSNLYGVPSSGAEFYLRMVQVDTNCDTVPDFTEEYLPHGGKITSWDTDSSGKWNVRHVVYPSEDGREESMFYVSPKNVLVTVTSKGGVPVKVTSGVEDLSVTSGSRDGFYWLSKKAHDFGERSFMKLEDECLSLLDGQSYQGVSIVVENEKYRLIGVRIEDRSYGVLVESEFPVSEDKAEDNEKK
ncbi:MAG: hypothetical protein KBS64_03355 [Treponema sp.]|nr:hypothetical protein [Candidatus Treponema equi]